MTVKIAAAMLGLAAAGAFHSALGAQQAAPAPQSANSAPAEAARSVWDGVYTEEQAKRGEVVYRQYCAACHGPSLMGGEAAGPLVGPVFQANWNGVTVGDLYERIHISMPQDRPGVLNRQENADVLAFMLSANKFPAGKAELSRQSEFLKEIRFLASKPETSPGSK